MDKFIKREPIKQPPVKQETQDVVMADAKPAKPILNDTNASNNEPINITPTIDIQQSKTTPNKSKGKKRSAKQKDKLQMSAKTVTDTPEPNKKTPNKSEDTQPTKTLEEAKVDV
jgi:hypothetical protein